MESSISGGPAIPLPKRQLRDEIQRLNDDLEYLVQVAHDWCDKFAKQILRIYHQKATRALLPEKNAMNKGLEALSLLTSEDFARSAFVDFEKKTDTRVSRERILGPLIINKETL